MPALKSKRRISTANYWPGFVDAMATLLLVIIFLLSVFMLTQLFLSREITGKESALESLNKQIIELTQLLSLERSTNENLQNQISILSANLSNSQNERTHLSSLLEETNQENDKEQTITQALQTEKEISAKALSQINLLNQQISALRSQISALEQALEASKKRDTKAQARIANLGQRLNVALAQRVQQLSRYRSDFFGRLRQLLSERSDIRIVGDRFVFQSEVLFSSGQDIINIEGRRELSILAEAIIELQETISTDIDWIIRVDGHTDARPLSGTGRFKNNWELSTARAVAVVQFLNQQGVNPKNLAAAGFGEYQPLEQGESAKAFAANRRIEFKLTSK